MTQIFILNYLNKSRDKICILDPGIDLIVSFEVGGCEKQDLQYLQEIKTFIKLNSTITAKSEPQDIIQAPSQAPCIFTL